MGNKTSSTLKGEVQSELQNNVSNTCVEKASCTLIQSGGKLVVAGTGNVVNASQKCKVDASCVIDSAIDALQRHKTDYESTAAGGIGIGDKTSSEILTGDKRTIKNELKNKCGDPEVKVGQYNQDVVVTGKFNKVDLSQLGDIKTQCFISAILKAAQDLDQKNKGGASGFDPTAIIIVVAIVALVLAIGGGVGYFMFKDKFAL